MSRPRGREPPRRRGARVDDEPAARPPRSPSAPPAPATDVGDPEQALAARPAQLRPGHAARACPRTSTSCSASATRSRAKIDAAADNPSRARLLSLRAVVSRILGDLRNALADAKMALVHAEATGELRRIAIAQARLANVLVRWASSTRPTGSSPRPTRPSCPDRLRATMHHHAGKSAFDQGRYIEACNHFEKALELRSDGDPELVAATEVALDAVFSRVAESGWGPYPRTRDEILLTHKPPVPDVRRALRPLGLPRPRRRRGRSGRSSPTSSRSATAWPGSARSGSRPGG